MVFKEVTTSKESPLVELNYSELGNSKEENSVGLCEVYKFGEGI